MKQEKKKKKDLTQLNNCNLDFLFTEYFNAKK